MTVYKIASAIQCLEAFHIDKFVQVASIALSVAYVLGPSFLCSVFGQLRSN